ncbi:helix-turn-helix domain-containing protein [Chamaesiphon polymorphus]|uniref:Transcriptional regulator n=1 Tax=Chamaesiphon polymorphus CCALA 037 TaxID=2107692 RepID=A0A2T1F8K1_9CYAN|nr:transcriptional regulator [Chamaesiphon polymorphus]PSB41238.1 transcriptional regulator [Chamaesiphon polymorphus CCALA 037]
MTIILDRDNYPQLLAELVPQAIDSETEYDRALAIAERLTFKQDKTAAELKLLKLIVVLIEDYETEHYPMDNVTPHELLQHLMASNNTRQADLVGLIGSRGVVSEVVNGKRAISKAQAKALGEFFNVSPGLFI